MSVKLQEIIKEEMAHSDTLAIPFVRFMELALYHPFYGYYKKDKKKVGKEGDFYTSATVHPVFAETLADKVVELWRRNGILQPTLVEIGGGTGHLMKHMMERIVEIAPDLSADLHVVLVETSPYHMALQQEQLKEFSCKKSWYSSLEEASSDVEVEGVILSNEWFDAFPVHVLEKRQKEWLEVGVKWDEETKRFKECLLPALTKEAESCISDVPTYLPDSIRLEINSHIKESMSQLAKMLKRGYILTIDYGDIEEKLYHPSRMRGTLMCYYQHQATTDPYQRVGEQDITAHVNFTSLMRQGEAVGMKSIALYRQDEFLIQSGILQKLQNHHDVDPFRSPVMKRNRAIQQLLAAGGMGGVFKFLIQGKAVELKS